MMFRQREKKFQKSVDGITTDSHFSSVTMKTRHTSGSRAGHKSVEFRNGNVRKIRNRIYFELAGLVRKFKPKDDPDGEAAAESVMEDLTECSLK
jgi:hypothetical protein